MEKNMRDENSADGMWPEPGGAGKESWCDKADDRFNRSWRL